MVINNATLLLGFAATLVLNVLCFPIFLVVAPYAISHRFSEEMWGYCLAASGFGACVGSVVTVVASGHERLMGLAVICGLFLAGAMALLGLGTSAWMAILGAAFVGIVEASWLTGWATAMQTLSPEKDLGKVVAVDTFVTSGAHPFIYLGSGVVGGIIGYSQTLTLNQHLGGDTGVVGARLPQGVATLHAAETDQGVHDRVVKTVTHVQAAGDVRRRGGSPLRAYFRTGALHRAASLARQAGCRV